MVTAESDRIAKTAFRPSGTATELTVRGAMRLDLNAGLIWFEFKLLVGSTLTPGTKSPVRRYPNKAPSICRDVD